MKIPVNRIFNAKALSNSEPNSNNIGLAKTNKNINTGKENIKKYTLRKIDKILSFLKYFY